MKVHKLITAGLLLTCIAAVASVAAPVLVRVAVRELATVLVREPVTPLA